MENIMLKLKCFACNRLIKQRRFLVRCADEQTVFIGPECFKRVKASSNGYQPSLGGPRLFLISDNQFESADD